MSAADIFKGLLALSAGGVTGYARGRHLNEANDLKQQLGDADLQLRMMNLERLVNSDAWHKDVAQQNANTNERGVKIKENESPYKIDNYGSLKASRDAAAKRGDRSLDMFEEALGLKKQAGIRESSKFRGAYDIDPMTGAAVKKPTPAKTGVSPKLNTFEKGVIDDVRKKPFMYDLVVTRFMNVAATRPGALQQVMEAATLAAKADGHVIRDQDELLSSKYFADVAEKYITTAMQQSTESHPAAVQAADKLNEILRLQSLIGFGKNGMFQPDMPDTEGAAEDTTGYDEEE